MQAYLERAQVQTTNSNGGGDDDDNDDTIQVEDVIDNNDDDNATTYRELVNNEFLSPIDQEIGATGATIEHDGVHFAQYSNYH